MQLILTPIVNAMILVPFILLFTLSGYLSDKFAKPHIMRWSAFAAVLITLSITYCYYHGLYKSAFGFTLVLATQSAIYSPAKYGYIRECLKKSGLSIGNAYVQAITLTSILLGTLIFTKFFSLGFNGEETQLLKMHLMTPEEILLRIAPVGWILVGLSMIELLATFGVRFYATKFSKVKLSFQKLITLKYLSDNIRVITKLFGIQY
jgi:acyl-[acyl-carrier-protein]-phospholipid O-acyltransferase/long-chain-fatty-acid--[acyl-carrier-protein] ligase